jgi:DNA-binding beta-propeller fold protein YncE
VVQLKSSPKSEHTGAVVILSVALALIVTGCAANADDRSAPLVLERTISLEHVGGRIDHLAVDLKNKRLMVAELGNDTVDVVDLASGKLVHRFEGLQEPQGIAYLPDQDVIVVANGGDGSVDFFSGSDFSTKKVLPLGDDADNVRRDPRNGHVVVGYSAGMLAVIDPVVGATLSNIVLPAHPEGFQIAPRADRIYVNIPDARQIAIIDLAAGKQVATWTFPGLTANYPLAVDDTGSILATVFRSPPRLVLLEGGTGSVTATEPTCGDADDVFFDSKRRRIYVSCGAGMIDVFDWHSTSARHLARIPTSSGARTSLFSPELDRLFVAARAGLLGSDAAVLVFQPNP